jgi:diphthamide biosynthesis enzyme Dph1/Dph2-like protein
MMLLLLISYHFSSSPSPPPPSSQHIQSGIVLQIHYGRASFSALSRLPAYFVLGHDPLDVPACARQISEYAAAPLNPAGMKALLVFLDQALLWALPQITKAVHKVCA